MQLHPCLQSFKMRFNTRIVTSVAAIALTCIVSAAAYFYRSRKSEINEVMIFCKLQFNVFNYFDKLLSYIEAAERSIHVCMPTVHNPAIQGRLVEVIRRKNISARIIIDGKGYNESTATFLEELTEAGAKIRMGIGEDRMHHKFCLIDDEILMTGTLDWGNDLSFDDWNYVYITSKDQLVEPIKREFDQMWIDERNTLVMPWDQTSEFENDDDIQNIDGTIVINASERNNITPEENNNNTPPQNNNTAQENNNIENKSAFVAKEVETNMDIKVVDVERFIEEEILFNNYQGQFTNDFIHNSSKGLKAIEVAESCS